MKLGNIINTTIESIACGGSSIVRVNVRVIHTLALFVTSATLVCATPEEWRQMANTVHGEVHQAHQLRAAFKQDNTQTNRLFEAERCYQRALLFAEILREMPVAPFAAMFTNGTVPDKYRPTLYDLVVHDLIDLYRFMAQSNIGYKRGCLSADGPAFDDTEKFMEQVPDQVLDSMPALRGLRLFQAVIGFHEKDPEPSAYADADLNRLLFCRALATGSDLEERFNAALDRFWNKWRKHEIMSRCLALRAQTVVAQKPAFARMLAQNGANTFPESTGAAQCRNIIAQIEEPSLKITTPAIWQPPWPELKFFYKNIEQVTLCAIPASGDTPMELLKNPPTKIWNAILPRASEYLERSYEVRVPQDLPVGHYLICATVNGKLEAEHLPILTAFVAVAPANSRTDAATVEFKLLTGTWQTKHEPDAWYYRTWREL